MGRQPAAPTGDCSPQASTESTRGSQSHVPFCPGSTTQPFDQTPK